MNPSDNDGSIPAGDGQESPTKSFVADWRDEYGDEDALLQQMQAAADLCMRLALHLRKTEATAMKSIRELENAAELLELYAITDSGE